MHSLKRWRYYCDFCKKSGANGGHIRTHEQHCIRNPNRVCRMCKRIDGDQQPVGALVEALRQGGVDALRRKANGCPVCMLAGVFTWKSHEKAKGVTDEDLGVDFNFDQEKDAFWQVVNEAADCGYRRTPVEFLVRAGPEVPAATDDWEPF